MRCLWECFSSSVGAVAAELQYLNPSTQHQCPLRAASSSGVSPLRRHCWLSGTSRTRWDPAVLGGWQLFHGLDEMSREVLMQFPGNRWVLGSTHTKKTPKEMVGVAGAPKKHWGSCCLGMVAPLNSVGVFWGNTPKAHPSPALLLSAAETRLTPGPCLTLIRRAKPECLGVTL